MPKAPSFITGLFGINVALRHHFFRNLTIGVPVLKGHSHYQNTKDEKAKLAAVKSKLFQEFSREIVRAVKEGGPDPDTNSQLATIISRATKLSYTREKIQESINVALRKNKEGPSSDVHVNGMNAKIGFSILVWGKTVRPEHFKNEIRTILKRYNVNADPSGAIKHIMVRKGLIRVQNLIDEVDPEKGRLVEDYEEAQMICLECGAEEVRLINTEEFGEVIEFLTHPHELEQVCEMINHHTPPGNAPLKILYSKTDMISVKNVSVKDEGLPVLEKLISTLYDHPDVVGVYDNVENFTSNTCKFE